MKKILLTLAAVVIGCTSFANTYTVTRAGTGPGSLSEAITDANAHPTTPDHPHIINVCTPSNLNTDGPYHVDPVPTTSIEITGPSDLSAQMGTTWFQSSPAGTHVTIRNFTFLNNGVGSFGSAIFVGSGGITVHLDHCLLKGNHSPDEGAVFNNGDTIFITNCTFDSNYTTGGYGYLSGGGAVCNNFGYMEITNSTFIHNYCTSVVFGGGAISNPQGGKLLVRNSTFYGNHSASRGGAIMRGNYGSGQVSLSNNIFVGNTADTAGAELFGGFTSANGHNIIADTVGSNLGGVLTGNIYGSTPTAVLDTVLRGNGRYEGTLALISGSPAIDASDNSVAPAIDARSFARIGTADMGAYEYGTTNLCAGITTTINPGLQGCGPQLNHWSTTTTGGAPLADAYWYDGTNYNCGDTLVYQGSGTFVVTVTDTNGCVAKDTVSVQYSSIPVISYPFTICRYDSVTFRGVTYHGSGIHAIPYACDSFVNVVITYTTIPQIHDVYNVCNVPSITINGHSYTVGGTYIDSFGCDSIVTRDITFISGHFSYMDTVLHGVSCQGRSDGVLQLIADSSSALTVALGGHTYSSSYSWASSVIAYSTQYSSGGYAATQLTGAPNTYPSYGDIGTSWTPQSYGSHRDSVVLGYNPPVQASEIAIYETYTTGMVDTVSVREAGTNIWHTVYAVQPVQSTAHTSVILHIPLPGTYLIDQVNMGVATNVATNWVEIDAVGLLSPLTIGALPAGVSYYTVTDSRRCSATDSAIIPAGLPSPSISVSPHQVTLCPGAGTTLTATTTASVLWSTTDTTHTVTVTPTQSNIYIATATGVNGCTSADTAHVSVLSVQHPHSAVEICTGQQINIGVHTYSQAGTYTDTLSCDTVLTTTITVNTPAVPVVTLSHPVSCVGLSDGSIVFSSDSTGSYSVTFHSQTYYSGPQWADTVLYKSREYSTSPGGWSAYQLLGAPNTYPSYGDIRTAWTASSYGDQRDTLIVGYGTPVAATEIDIYQTYTPGYIDSVFVREYPAHTWHRVYTHHAQADSVVATILTVPLPGTYSVDAVRLDIATDSASDWVEIDAIGLQAPTQISGLPSGSYPYISTDANGCHVTDTVVLAQGYPLPNVSINLPQNSFCIGPYPAVMLQGGLPAGGAFSGSIVVNDTIGLVSATPGNYTIQYTYTDTNGCTNSATDTIALKVCTGIDEVPAGTVRLDLYPNPNNGTFVITCDVSGDFVLVDALGAQIAEMKLAAGVPYSFTAGGIASGIYYLTTRERADVRSKVVVTK